MKVLVVDDDEGDRYACRRVLESRGFEIVEADTPKAAMDALEREAFVVVLTDYNLRSAEDGLDVLACARSARPEARRVLMSSCAMPAVVQRACEGSLADMFFEKPAGLAEWTAALDRAVGRFSETPGH